MHGGCRIDGLQVDAHGAADELAEAAHRIPGLVEAVDVGVVDVEEVEQDEVGPEGSGDLGVGDVGDLRY